MMKATLSSHFPNTVTEAAFIRGVRECLASYGFDAGKTLICLSLCRETPTHRLARQIEKIWGAPFRFSGLAGMLCAGKIGFMKAQRYVQRKGGPQRCIYFAFTHIGLTDQGQFGFCWHRGPGKPSPACGALAAIQRELASGSLTLRLDPDDIEQSLLKQRLLRKLNAGDTPDLLSLTKVAHEVVISDLERLIMLTMGTSRVNYSVISGVQIHGPEFQEFIWPGSMYAVVEGQRYRLSLSRPNPAGQPS